MVKLLHMKRNYLLLLGTIWLLISGCTTTNDSNAKLLEQLPMIPAKEVTIIGHSRSGRRAEITLKDPQRIQNLISFVSPGFSVDEFRTGIFIKPYHLEFTSPDGTRTHIIISRWGSSQTRSIHSGGLWEGGGKRGQMLMGWEPYILSLFDEYRAEEDR
jgi:hypothetical protein